MTPDQPTAPATPRTDAQPLVKIYDRAGMPYDSELVSPDFARTLERELSSAQAALAGAKAEVARLKEFCREFVWGEENPAVYQALHARAERAESEIERHKKARQVEVDAHQITVEQRDQLRARVAELEKLYTEERAQNPTLVHRLIEDERDQLQRRVAELEQDKARLDWLESKSKYVTSAIGAHRGYHDLPSIAVDYWCGKTGVTAGLGMTPATLRAAIDAARKGQL